MSEAPDLSAANELAELTVASTPEELAAQIEVADALLVWDFRLGDLGSLLARARRLRWIHAASVGVDALLSPELRASTIALTNSRGVFDTAIAEYVAMLILAKAKDFRVTLAHQAVREWRHRITRSVAGRRVVVLGTGSIGRAIAALLGDMGLSVALVGREPGSDKRFGAVAGSKDLPAVCQGADYLVVAAPLTPFTHHLVDAATLAALGPGGYLVNVARAGLVDTEALIGALRSEALAGAAIDTFDVEPLPIDSPLWTLPGVVVSPHMSGDFAGFDDALVAVFRDNLERFRAGRDLANVVDYVLGYVPSASH